MNSLIGDWELGIGNWEWGMGNGALGMGHCYFSPAPLPLIVQGWHDKRRVETHVQLC
jgi:hypothetical protein